MAKKMTLLEMTQNILSSLNSDEVNSIFDTVESRQVAEEIKTTYEELYTNRDIAELESLVNLEGLSDSTKPNRLILPDNVDRIKWLRYRDYRDSGNDTFKFIDYLDPEEFITRIVDQSQSSFAATLAVPLTDTSPIEYYIAVDRGPSYYTILDNDRTLVFDSFDGVYESSMAGSNAVAWGFLNNTFEMTDTYVAPIDANLFPHFLAEAKSTCFINIKEAGNSKEEQRARRQLVRSQIRTNKTNAQRKGVFDGNDYARKR
jgi:hypothetical protein